MSHHRRPRPVHSGSLMKPLCLALALASPVIAGAQTHVALSLLSSQVKLACTADQRCSDSGQGFSFSLDAPMPAALAWDLGALQLDTIEVAYTQYGHGTVSQTVSQQVVVGRPSPGTRLVKREAKVSPSGIALNLLAHAPLIDDVAAHVRLGVGVVSSTVAYTDDGATLGSVTENKVRPVIGLGLSWAATPAWALTLDWDHTRYETDGGRGGVQAWRLGVRWAP